MTGKSMFWLLLTAAVMILFPWLLVTLVPSEAGMTAVLVLFFVVNPGHCMAAGYYSGKQMKRLWWVPAFCAGAYLTGAWSFLEAGDPAFFTYAGIYFALGMEAMFVSRLITGRREPHG